MRLFLRLILTTTLILAGGLTTTNAAGFYFKGGVGYDFLSQEYFLDSASQSGADSLLTNWSLRTNYLDNFKGLVSARVLPLNDRRLEFNVRYEQTEDLFRLKFASDIRTKLGSTKLDISNQLDWRHRISDSASFGDSYLFGLSKSRLSIPIGRSFNTVIQGQAEFVTFDSTSAYNFDYYRWGGKIGLEKTFEDFSFGDLKLTFMARTVPDSAVLNYLHFGAEGSFLGFYNQGQIELYGRMERKDYNQPGGIDDYWRGELNCRNKIKLSDRYYTRQDLEFEMSDYSPLDAVNRDYYRIRLTALIGLDRDNLTLGLGPQAEALHEDKDDYSISYDYLEIGGKVDADYMKLGRVFLSVESVFGYRDLKDNTELQTDYAFERLNVIGDLTVYRGLSLNFLFSAEWEWHRIITNDSRIYLVSSNLVYSF